jgi:hypothetical protein
MTEAEWLACKDPEKMLEFEKRRPSGSARKQRLFACACCRQAGDLIADGACREAVEVAERFADGLADPDDLVWAFQAAHEVADELRGTRGDAAALPADLASTACEDSSEMAYYAWLYLLGLTPRGSRAARRAWGRQAVRCLWGPLPFRPVAIDRAWLTPAVKQLAGAIYDDRAFGRLPALADALEEAGCNAAELLAHLRGPGPHVLGCWALDLIAGKS